LTGLHDFAFTAFPMATIGALIGTFGSAAQSAAFGSPAPYALAAAASLATGFRTHAVLNKISSASPLPKAEKDDASMYGTVAGASAAIGLFFAAALVITANEKQAGPVVEDPVTREIVLS